MKALQRGEILAAADLPREFVRTPEWAGGDPEAGVWIQAFNGATRARFVRHIQAAAKDQEQDAEIPLARERLIAFTAVDEQGGLLFSEDDIPELAKRNDKVLERLAGVARRLNTLGAQAEADAGNVSPAIPSSSSGSGSPKPSEGGA
jgi:hypothetical protein